MTNPNNNESNSPDGYSYGDNGYGSQDSQDYSAQYGEQYSANAYNQQYAQPGYGAAATAPANNLALASLIVGIVSLVLILIFPFVSIISGIVAVVLGFMGMRKANEIQAAAGGYPVPTRKGMAVGGLVTGIIAFLIGAALTILALFVFNEVKECQQYVNNPEKMEQCIEDRVVERFGGK
ncbi:DUF4190 domain-containing protein [Corynebacterium sp. HMSC29G08]|uniref:DUF4190 domain-containing protein n=1 Tax=Corynebacterium sp. HMSC29G08 TaxID=1581069 RepID=UPI0008A62D31|nr:DUF4190 domain-containing protein [Corynebacterium sp. HMSC29G08]OFT86096.1 hypothetical protein HMPREF3101_01340 [Corynebacterium sp. HMSC29G08]